MGRASQKPGTGFAKRWDEEHFLPGNTLVDGTNIGNRWDEPIKSWDERTLSSLFHNKKV